MSSSCALYLTERAPDGIKGAQVAVVHLQLGADERQFVALVRQMLFPLVHFNTI